MIMASFDRVSRLLGSALPEKINCSPGKKMGEGMVLFSHLSLVGCDVLRVFSLRVNELPSGVFSALS